MSDHQMRILRLEQDMEALRETDEELGVTLDRLDQNTKDIIDFFEAFRGAFRTLEIIAKTVRPIAYILMFASATAGVAATLKELGVL